MEYTFDVLDITQYEEKKIKPATLVPRRSNDYWLVRDLPLFVEDIPSKMWGWCNEGDVVRIPLYPYISNGPSLDIALAFAFNLGFMARDMFDDKYEIARVHIVTGAPVQEVQADPSKPHLTALRFWCGFGCVLSTNSRT